MDFLDDYWKYISCYEIPRSYSFWTAFGLLGAVVNRKVYFMIGDTEVHSNLYILLVGPQGNHKSFANDIASDLFIETCPDLEVGASTQSAEDIVATMAKPEFARSFTNHRGEVVEVRPYAFFINEFKDFIAYNPTRMLNFLTNIYDRKYFRASTIKRGLEPILNPCLNIVACENPEQLSDFMKSKIMTGGLSRRFIIVYETGYGEPKSKVVITPEARAAFLRVKDRIAAIRSVTGEFTETPSWRKFYDPWYIERHKTLPLIASPIMRGYVATKHVQLMKICTLIDACSDKPMLNFTGELFELGLAHLDAIEGNMPKLSMTAGRNEAMGAQLKVLETLKENDGWLPEKHLKRLVESDFKTIWELDNTLRHLQDTDQIVRGPYLVPNENGDKIQRMMILLPTKYKDLVNNGALKPATPPPSAASG